MENVDMILQQI